jgi:hypothetical protein
LSFLLSVGSPQSKEGSQPVEEKTDALVRQICPDDAARILRDLEQRYPKE